MPTIDEARLLIPIAEAAQMGEELEEVFPDAAEKVGADCDGGEEEGATRSASSPVYLPPDLTTLVTKVLRRRLALRSRPK